MEDKEQDKTMKERIIGLLAKGYKRSQLINDLGLQGTTIDSQVSY